MGVQLVLDILRMPAAEGLGGSSVTSGGHKYEEGRVMPIWHLRSLLHAFDLHLVMLLLTKPCPSMSFHATEQPSEACSGPPLSSA